MSPLESVAEVLAQSLEPADSADRRALAEVLQERLYHLLAVPDVPLDLRVQFGNPLEPGQYLAEWCRARIASQEGREAAMAPLLSIAALLDCLVEKDSALLVFVPSWFRIDERGRPLVFPPQLALGMKQPGQTQLTDRQRRSYARLVPPSLLKTLTHCDVRSALLYSFALFLARLLLNVDADSKKQLLLRLRRCRLRDQGTSPPSPPPPELPELLHGILSRPLDLPPGCTCRELAGQILEQILGNPFVTRPELTRTIEHQVYAYSVIGLNKLDPVNEDRVLCRSHGPISFALVADGVSTVDLGSGEMAAEEIVRVFRQHFQPRFDALAETLRQQVEADPGSAWPAETERFLRDFFLQAEQQVVELANQLLPASKESIPEAPLCATLTAAMVVYDQALLAFVGDSPALLFRRSSGRLTQLSVSDHAELEEGYEPDSGIDPHGLTRVIGQCQFDPERRRLEPIEQAARVVRVQLQPGDLLLLASDGLVECINEPTSADRFARLESELQRLHIADHPLNKLVRGLIRLGEEGLSDDNISTAAIRIRGAAVVDKEGKG